MRTSFALTDGALLAAGGVSKIMSEAKGERSRNEPSQRLVCELPRTHFEIATSRDSSEPVRASSC
jgi:hypothetical protein